MVTLTCLCQPTWHSEYTLCPQEEAELELLCYFSWQKLLCVTGTCTLPLRSRRSSARDTLCGCVPKTGLFPAVSNLHPG